MLAQPTAGHATTTNRVVAAMESCHVAPLSIGDCLSTWAVRRVVDGQAGRLCAPYPLGGVGGALLGYSPLRRLLVGGRLLILLISPV